MTTTNQYLYKKPWEPIACYAVDTSGSNNVKMGEMLKWYAAGPYAIPLTAGAEALFVGVAESVAPTPVSNIDNTTGLVSTVRVRTCGVFAFKTTAGQTYSHGDAVKMGADAQTVSNASVTTAYMGYVWRPEATATLTGAAGTSVDVAIVCQYPATGLL